MTLGIVCGLRSEARAIARGLARAGWTDLRIAVCGARPERAEALARELVADGATHLVSAGLAGGLDPSLRTGDVVWARLVASDAADERGLCGGPSTDSVYGIDRPLLSREAKAAAWRETGARVVDMESHRVARVARIHRLPFLAVRAVIDPQSAVVPAVFADAVSPDGAPRIGPLLLALTARPGLLADGLRLARWSRMALDGLQSAVARLPERVADR